MYKSRKATKFLNEWKSAHRRKPLVIRGARQVGKSTLVKEFGKQFNHFVYLNLERADDVKYFKEVSNIETVRTQIFVDHNVPAEATDCLIFIDEIQEAPVAIQQLRYFFEDLPDLAIIAAGSLLEFATAQVGSFPVGRVTYYQLHPLDFEEFLLWTNRDAAIPIMETVPFPDQHFDSLLKWYKEYVMIGGMPEVVLEYSRTKSVAGLNRIYADQWLTYEQDAEKYAASTQQRAVLRFLISAAPFAEDRIKFAKFGNSDYGSREIGEGLRTLDMARLLRLVYPTTATKVPATNNLSKRPRIQFLDTGLINHALNIQAELLQIDDLSAYDRGRIIQHHITQELIAKNDHPSFQPNFWVRENSNASSEVDLVYAYGPTLIPIEIKSGAKGRLRSLHEYMDRCDHLFAVRFLKNKFHIEPATTRTGKKFWLMNLPYFLFSQIDRYLELLEEHATTHNLS